MYLLDTNIFGFLFQKNPNIISKFQSTDPSMIKICSIVWAEINLGLLSMQNAQKQVLLINFYKEVKSKIKSYPFDEKSAMIFARIKHNSQKSGKNIEVFDSLIASIALANDLILVTNNTKHFSNIPNLKIEDWSK
jgi:tRNA(fMet)-specific endonuclease VapC